MKKIIPSSIIVFSILIIIIIFIPNQNDLTTSRTPGSQSTSTVEVLRVIDGDTVQTTLGTVRLLGIDAPEFGRCFYAEAKDELTKLVNGKEVSLVSDSLNEDVDKYDRLLRYVYLVDGTSVNQILISTGYARHLSWFPIEQNENFANLEKTAKKAKLGLWQECY